MTSPTPIDGLVWSYHQLGWSTRRIAKEVSTSQASVQRIIDRLKKDPPTGENTVIMTTTPTPPNGVPAIPDAWDESEPVLPRRSSPGMTMLTILTLLLVGALAATLLAANGGIIARGKPGPPGPPGPSGPPAARDFTVCVRYSTFSGAIVSMTAPHNGKCGSATMIRIPQNG